MNGFSSFWSGMNEMAIAGLAPALVAAQCAAPLAMVALAVDLAFRRWMTASLRASLWLLVLARMLLPVAPGSAYSFANAIPADWRIEWEFSDLSLEWPNDPEPTSDRIVTSVGVERAAEVVALDLQPNTQPRAEMARWESTGMMVIEGIADNLGMIWFLGLMTSVAWTSVGHWRFGRAVRRSAVCNDPAILALWSDAGRDAAISREIPIVLFAGARQPALMGWWRPKLLLPPDVLAQLDTRSLRMVMLHELAHLRRWDIAANWLLLLIRSVQWWNPFFWFSASRYRSLREEACDAFVLRRIAGEPMPERAYGELLLALAERSAEGWGWRLKLPASILGFSMHSWWPLGRHRALSRRIRALGASARPRSRGLVAASMGLVAIVVACGFTNASADAPSTLESFLSAPRDATGTPRVADFSNVAWSATPDIDAGPTSTREYEMAKILAAADEQHTRDQVMRCLNGFFDQSVSPVPPFQPDGTQTVRTPCSYVLEGDRLVVQAAAGRHEELRRILDVLEQRGLQQVAIEVRFIQADRDFCDSAGVVWKSLEGFTGDEVNSMMLPSRDKPPVVRAKSVIDEAMPVVAAKIDEQQIRALIEKAQSSRRTSLLFAPKVTLFQGQQARIADVTYTPFVVGAEQPREFENAGTAVMQPKIKIVEQGIVITLMALPEGEPRRLRLSGHVRMSEIKEVRQQSANLYGQETTVQVPVVGRNEIDVASELDQGQSLLVNVGAAKHGAPPMPGEYLYLLFTPRMIEE